MRAAPDENVLTEGVGDTNLSHKWCMRCVPPPPLPAMAFCGFTTTRRRVGVEPPMPACAVCVDLVQYGCERCGR